MSKRLITCITLLLAIAANAQFARSFQPSVRTTQMLLNDEWGTLPVIRLGSDDVLKFSFDEMSHIYRRYRYHIVHCNAEWLPSDLL